MKKTFVALFLFALLGFTASLVMTRMHYQLAARGLEEKSFCNVSDFLDCDTALVSRYSSVDTPVGRLLNSELGVLYYLLVALGLIYAAFSPSARPGTLGFLFFSLLFAITYSLVMAYLSTVKLGVLCLLCLTTYVSNFVLLLLLPKVLGIRYGQVPAFIGRYLKSFFGKGELRVRPVFHVVVTAMLVVVGLLFFRGLNPRIHKVQAQVPREAYLKAFEELPIKEIDTADRPSWGNPNAKVTVSVFSDFQCPFCRIAAFTLKPYLKAYKDNIRFVYLHYPLDNSCNPSITQAMHPVSCLASKATLCAKRQGKFWDYHDKVFENQKRLSRDLLVQLAKDSGMEQGWFEQCLASDDIAAELQKDIAEGTKAEVRGTPAVFLNGRPVHDWTQPDRLRLVIEHEISRAERKED